MKLWPQDSNRFTKGHNSGKKDPIMTPPKKWLLNGENILKVWWKSAKILRSCGHKIRPNLQIKDHNFGRRIYDLQYNMIHVK